VNITKDRLHIYNAVDYYTSRGSYVCICFVDFSKAFDRMNCELLEIVNNSRAIFASSWRKRVFAVTARPLVIFRRTCTPAILFWAYSYAEPSYFGRFSQIFWRIIRPYTH